MTTTSQPPRTAARRLGAVAAALALAALPVLGLSSPAWAHDALRSATPAAGETVTSLDSVTLTFSDDVLDLGNNLASFAIQVIGPDGRYYESGCPGLDGAVMSTATTVGPDGEYTILWQAISADGHTTSDSYAFTLAGEAQTERGSGGVTPTICTPADDAPAGEATADNTTGPSVTDESGPTTATATMAPEQSGAAGPTFLAPLVAAIALVVVAVAAIGVALRLRRRSGA